MKSPPPKKRLWKDYSVQTLNDQLAALYTPEVVSLSDNLNVQEVWNVYETWIVKACDKVAPLVDQPTGVRSKKVLLPNIIQSKIIEKDLNKRLNLKISV